MSLKNGKINPLGLVGMRKIPFIPDHFSKISIPILIDIKLIDHWIDFNLNSRYAIRKNYILDQDKKMVEVIEIGFEDPKELTILSLGCPYLHTNERKM